MSYQEYLNEKMMVEFEFESKDIDFKDIIEKELNEMADNIKFRYRCTISLDLIEEFRERLNNAINEKLATIRLK